MGGIESAKSKWDWEHRALCWCVELLAVVRPEDVDGGGITSHGFESSKPSRTSLPLNGLMMVVAVM